MKQIWEVWKQGWLVAGRYIWFGCVLGFWCIPLSFVHFLAPGVESEPVFNPQGLQWRVVIYFVALLVWLPFAFYQAASFTGYLKGRHDAGVSPNGGPAEPFGNSDVRGGPGR
jgi:hypothetical protein